MSASRSSSMRALKQLSASCSKQQTRSLHMCEPRQYPSRLASSQKASSTDRSRSKARKAGDRSSSPHREPRNGSRSMSTFTNARPAASPSTLVSGPAKASNRTFNTSRSHKTPKDTSTVDFAFLPMNATSLSEPSLQPPVLPHVSSLQPIPGSDMAAEPEKVFVSQIRTVSGASTYAAAPSAMSELHDNESLDHDYHAVVEALTIKNPEPAPPSTLRTLWNGMVDDVLGAKGKVAVV